MKGFEWGSGVFLDGLVGLEGEDFKLNESLRKGGLVGLKENFKEKINIFWFEWFSQVK